MKKLIFFAVFISNYTFGQSFTIEPADANKTLSIKYDGIGIDHRDNSGTVGIGTYMSDLSGFIQTHTIHPLRFATNNGGTQMILLTNGNNGNLGIGTTSPIQKLHVAGNAYFSGDFNSTGQASAGTLNIGGGSTITKFMEVYLVGQPIVAMNTNICNTQQYTATGFKLGDAVMLYIEGIASTNIVIANARAYDDLLEVKYCNIGSTTTTAQNVNMRVAIIR